MSSSLQNFVIWKNIERFTNLLENERDPATRHKLGLLLAAENEKLRDSTAEAPTIDLQPRKGPNG